MPGYICPHCRKPIYDDEALLCLYCGESLHRSVGLMGKMKYPRPKIIIAAIIIAVSLAFLIFITQKG